MEPEMVSTTVDNALAFLQLRDKYKQELVEDTRLTKATDLAAKQHVLLTSDAPDAWKRPQLKAVSRQLRHWTKKVRQPFGAPAGGVSATGATTPGDDDFEAGPMQAWFTQLVKATQGIKQGSTPAGPRNHLSRPNRTLPPVPKRNSSLRPNRAAPSWHTSCPFQRSLEQNPGIPPVNVWTPSRKRSSAGFAKKPPVSPKRKPLVWPRKRWIGKRGKPRDGTDPETPYCCTPCPTEATTIATRGQVI